MCMRFIDLIHPEIHYRSIIRWIKLIMQCDVSQHSASQSTGKQFALELARRLLTFIIIIYKPCQSDLHRTNVPPLFCQLSSRYTLKYFSTHLLSNTA